LPSPTPARCHIRPTCGFQARPPRLTEQLFHLTMEGHFSAWGPKATHEVIPIVVDRKPPQLLDTCPVICPRG
jgi:hypothetical protein